MKFIHTPPLMPSLSRRRFVQGLVLGSALVGLAAGLSLALPNAVAERTDVEMVTGLHSEFSRMYVQPKATGWSVSGRLRLLADPLRHSNPGRVVLEAVAPNGRILAASEATIYRVVTANPRVRLFEFHGELNDGFPAGVMLRVQHLPAGP